MLDRMALYRGEATMNKPYHILVVDDEESMTELVTAYLTKEDFQVTTAHDGLEAIEKVKQSSIDLIVLDVMMPWMDGFDACEAIREFSHVPIIMLTAKGEEASRVTGLNIGADDYIVKPFSFKELVARIEALLRRSNRHRMEAVNKLHVGTIVIDVEGRTIRVDDQFVSLTRKEYDLLYVLAKNKDKVFSREQLHELIWGMDDAQGTLRTVDTHIKTLRLKLGKANEYIKTVWGVGYKLEVAAS